jgi:hypothetical protein
MSGVSSAKIAAAARLYPTFLLRRLCECQIAQIPTDDGVDVCVDSGLLHRHRAHLRVGHARGGTSSRVPRASINPITLKPAPPTATKIQSYAGT